MNVPNKDDFALDIRVDEDSESWIVDIEGFEGPLDLLLTMARAQKVDLREISVLELAEKYLEFVETAKALRIELAADYLVMAAWLAYLKSRLLLPPEPQDDGVSAEDLAAHLAFQIERLAAMRNAANQLLARNRLGVDIFSRGAPERIKNSREITYSATLYDLLTAYARVKTREDFCPFHFERGPVLSMEEALERMRGLIGDVLTWQDLEAFLPIEWREIPEKRRSAMAANFAAVLQLVKEGQLELQQSAVFAPIRLRSRTSDRL